MVAREEGVPGLRRRDHSTGDRLKAELQTGDCHCRAKKKPVVTWEMTTGLRGGEGRNFISRELWGDSID
jgi:hypothetical protein